MLPQSFKPRYKCELIRIGSNNNSNNIELPNKLDAPNNIHKKEINLKFNKK